VTTELRPTPTRANGVMPRPPGAHAAVKSGRLRSSLAVAAAPAKSTAPPKPPKPAKAAKAATPASTAALAATAATSARSAAADFAAALVAAAVVPLALLQLPDAIAWAIPPQFAGAASMSSLLRASGLAISAMAIAAPLGGLAVRRFRAWPVLMAGLGIFGLADIVGNTTRTIAQVGIDRSLHGAGAGIALAAVVALVAERPKAARRALAGWQSACIVVGLAVAAQLMRQRLAGGDWHAALRPYPWLTGVALGLTGLYALLADGAVTASARNNFPAAERAHLALLAAPVAGLTAIALAVSYDRSTAVSAAAIAVVLALCGLAIMASRAGTAGWTAAVSAVTGFTLAPAAGAATDLLRESPRSQVTLAAALTAAILGGAALAVLLPARRAGLVIACGLSLAAAGFAASYLAGLLAPDGRLFAAACATLTGGLVIALTTAMRGTGVAGAISGSVLLLAGVLAGYLADGAIELQAVSVADRDAATVHAALLTADARWNIAAATLTAAVALAAFASALTRSTANPSRDRATSTEVDH